MIMFIVPIQRPRRSLSTTIFLAQRRTCNDANDASMHYTMPATVSHRISSSYMKHSQKACIKRLRQPGSLSVLVNRCSLWRSAIHIALVEARTHRTLALEIGAHRRVAYGSRAEWSLAKTPCATKGCTICISRTGQRDNV